MKKINITGVLHEGVAQLLAEGLSEAKGGDVEIDVASPGGDVFAGFQMYNSVSDYKKANPRAELQLNMKGVVASMASYFASNPAFGLVTAADNAVFMIHNPHNIAIGDYRDMEENARFLKGLAGNMALAYSAKFGGSIDKAHAAMDQTTWYFGDEIKESGFASLMEGSLDQNKDEKKERKSRAIALAQAEFGSMISDMQKTADAKANAKKAAAMMDTIPVLAGTENKEVPAGKGEKEDMEIKTLDDLKANASGVYTEALATISADAIASERARVKLLDDLKAKAGKVGAAVALIDEAKADGRSSADIAGQVMDLVLSAAESAGSINANGEGDEAAEADAYVPIAIIQ